jgi:CubicO group peptidase (beta-lactamase class C family)
VALLLACDGKISHQTIAGWHDIEAGTPLEWDAIFRIASMTKPFVAAVVMMLYEEGCLRLDDPVWEYIPAFSAPRVFVEGGETRPAESDITIRHLLTHTSGICYGGSAGYMECMRGHAERSGLRDAPLTLTTREAVEAIAGIPLRFDPGTEWGYGPSTDVLGHVLEIVAGIALDELLAERVFGPLGMTDTGFHVPEEKRDRLAPMYALAGGRLAKSSDSIFIGPLRWSPDDVYRDTLRWHQGGGGLTSTVHDYVRFGQMLVNRGELDDARVLQPKTVDLMSANAIGACQ